MKWTDYTVSYGGKIILIFIKQYIKYHFTNKVIELKNYSLGHSLTARYYKFCDLGVRSIFNNNKYERK